MQSGLAPALVSPTVDNGLLLLGSFALLLLGAEVFTNGVEWLGHRLGVSESATGSVLAAVGTALPETLIPVIAIAEGGADAAHVGVGAILGAPFMLATLAMFLLGASAYSFRDRRTFADELNLDRESTVRDLAVFLAGYTLAFAVALVPRATAVGPVTVRELVAGVLVLLYAAYLHRSLRGGELAESEELDALHLGRTVERLLSRVGDDPKSHGEDPQLLLVAVQTVVALALIVAGAHLFVGAVTWLSTDVLGVPVAVVALLVAPVATELPEKFNSVLWIARDKDTLAIGNVTGAMAFQATLPVTLGVLFTPWDLTLAWGTTGFLNAFSVVLAVASGAILFYRVRATNGRPLRPAPLLVGGAFYAAFVALLLYHVLVVGLASS